LHSSGNATVDKSDGSISNKIPADEKSDSYVFDPANPYWDISFEKSYPYDQRDNENRKDVIVYTSAPIEADLEVVGEVVAELFVSSTAKDTDFSITLTDVDPDGKSINLSGLDAGYLRMRYRNGFDKQELMQPNEVYKIRIGQLYTGNLFKKGHRIRLQITSSKAPHYDPNPNSGTEIATEKNLVPATNTIHHSKKYPSKLILPVITMR
jgi:putative CocE/NonD family hydrolase